jgi:integrase
LSLESGLELFLDSIKSEQTRKNYMRYLKWYEKEQGHNLAIQQDPKTVETQIINFIIKSKKEGKSYAAIHNYVAALKAYYQINDVVLNVRKIGKFMPEQKRVRNKKDRAYTHEEISKMLEVADLRMRVVILLLASSGCRIGSLSVLKLGNLVVDVVDVDQQDMNMKLTIYENAQQEYFSFITPECKKAVDAYLDMRSRYGEKLSDSSPLIREEFNVRVSDIKNKKARPVATKTLIWKLDGVTKRAGVRSKDIALAHGFRKFFTTQLIKSNVKAEARLMLEGHSIGITDHYWRPTEDELYYEYEKAIDNLTIDPSQRLQKKVEMLTIEKSKADLALTLIAEMKKRIDMK